MENKDTEQTDSVRQSKKKSDKLASTQTFLKISEIKESTVVLKNGGIRSVLKASSINFNLKSEEEQNAIIYSYQGFLNTLNFPIQILVRSKKLDIDEYLKNLKEVGEKQKNSLLQQQTFEYVEYISRLIEYADIMEKEFYVIIPYDPYRTQKLNILQKFFLNMSPADSYTQIKRRNAEFAELKKKLNQRVNTVKVGLENCGIKVTELSSTELVELYYNSYNPLLSRYQKGKDAINSNITEDI